MLVLLSGNGIVVMLKKKREFLSVRLREVLQEKSDDARYLL